MPVIPWLLTVIGAMWTTGNVLLVIVAGLAFGWVKEHPTLITREGAGGIFGAALGVWSTVVCALVVVAAVALGVLAVRAWRRGARLLAVVWLACLLAGGGVHTVNHLIIAEANTLAAGIRDLRAADSGPDSRRADDRLHGMEVRFAALHHASEAWHGIETLLALALLAGGSVALLRRPKASVPAGTA